MKKHCPRKNTKGTKLTYTLGFNFVLSWTEGWVVFGGKFKEIEMKFELYKTSGQARRGQLTLAHGTVQTPAFMPVGT